MHSRLTRALVLAAPLALLAACATEPASTQATPAAAPPTPAPVTAPPTAPPPAVVTAPAPAPRAPAPLNMSVRDAQQRLLDKGYDPGTVDGVAGPRTASALRQFQRDQGLMATGRLDSVTIQALGR
ncbi:peptidoglycan-binding domain-containing protein [Ottowia sp.]|uniref:peptidoglycan-binding domain-containing protein n=1 Tax=Ottowia sp. TaxID=1898956 RepID=UPI002D1A1D31|nr:peptidoglycan-binding domain-containing protein [Ottowia sp.]HRN75551.1 peptidoglycan-binding domain-containing protein [Ottowia sp.]HRQ02397.1 peptidoglycan-binding domain-containing protein [Ottowia sp.]